MRTMSRVTGLTRVKTTMRSVLLWRAQRRSWHGRKTGKRTLRLKPRCRRGGIPVTAYLKRAAARRDYTVHTTAACCVLLFLIFLYVVHPVTHCFHDPCLPRN